jgi:hypothetical protein
MILYQSSCFQSIPSIILLSTVFLKKETADFKEPPQSKKAESLNG